MSTENNPPTPTPSPPVDPIVPAPLARRVEVEICADCNKYARVFIIANTPEAAANNEGITVRNGYGRCRKDACGNCFPYPYPLNQAAKDVLVKPMLTAETQIVAAITGLSIDVEAQDEIRKLAGTCGACLMDVAALLHDKHPYDMNKLEPLDITWKEVRDYLAKEKKDIQQKHRTEHRTARHVPFPRVIIHITEPEVISTPPSSKPGNSAPPVRTLNGKPTKTAAEKAELLEQLKAEAAKARDQQAKSGSKQPVNLDGHKFTCPICACDKTFTFDGLNIHLSHCLGMDYPNLKLTRARIMTWLLNILQAKQQMVAAKSAAKTPVQAKAKAVVKQTVPPKLKPKSRIIRTKPAAHKQKRTAKGKQSAKRRGKPIKMPRLDESEEETTDSETTPEEDSEEEREYLEWLVKNRGRKRNSTSPKPLAEWY